MNIDNFLEQGLTFSEINILAKFEENGYDPENIYKMYKGFNLRELLEDVTKNNLKQEDISTFLNAKTFGNEEILKIVCDRTVKSDIKQPLLTLAGLSKNWKRFYTKEYHLFTDFMLWIIFRWFSGIDANFRILLWKYNLIIYSISCICCRFCAASCNRS